MSARPLTLEGMAQVRASARVAKVAALLDCAESDIRRMIEAGKLEAHGHGIRGVRVFLDSVASYQDGRAILPKPPKAKLESRRTAVSRAAQRESEAALRKTGILP